MTDQADGPTGREVLVAVLATLGTLVCIAGLAYGAFVVLASEDVPEPAKSVAELDRRNRP